MLSQLRQTPTIETSIAQPTIQRDCAWCNKKAGRDQGNGSHDICPSCEQEQLLLLQAARSERKLRKGR